MKSSLSGIFLCCSVLGIIYKNQLPRQWQENLPIWFPLKSLFFYLLYQHFTSVHLLSCVQLFVTPWTAASQASLLKLMSIELVMPSKHHILYHPLLLPALIFLSFRVFSNESALCIRRPKHCKTLPKNFLRFWTKCFQT